MLHVDTHPFFQRDENNIICEMPVTFLQAILGDVIEVPGIDGINELKIPQGTQSGSILKLKGKGFPNINGYNRGDQLIKITVEIPTNLNERQKDLLRQFAQINTDDIHQSRKPFKENKEFFK